MVTQLVRVAAGYIIAKDLLLIASFGQTLLLLTDNFIIVARPFTAAFRVGQALAEVISLQTPDLLTRLMGISISSTTRPVLMPGIHIISLADIL